MTARNTVALFDAPMKISPMISCGRIDSARWITGDTVRVDGGSKL